MDLATETRIEIFRYVIPEKVTLQLISSITTRVGGVIVALPPTPPLPSLPPNPALPLLLTNSEIKNEVSLIPKTSLVLSLDGTWRDDFPRWLQGTSPSYRANFSGVGVSLETQWQCQDPLEAQRVLNRVDEGGIGTNWEALYTSDAKKAFDHVECTYRSRRTWIVSESPAASNNGVFLREEYRWTIAGARDFGDGGRTRPRRKCTKPRGYW